MLAYRSGTRPAKATTAPLPKYVAAESGSGAAGSPHLFHPPMTGGLALTDLLRVAKQLVVVLWIIPASPLPTTPHTGEVSLVCTGPRHRGACRQPRPHFPRQDARPSPPATPQRPRPTPGLFQLR